MRFILTGFTQDTGFRVFTFEGVGPDQTRTGFSVGADLALSRRYGIRMQELPLLCREFLERCSEGEQARTFTFTEAEMLVYAKRCAAERQARLIESTVLPQIEHAFELARLGYASGEGTFSEVLDARRLLLSTQLEYVEARAGLARARAGLETATGAL